MQIDFVFGYTNFIAAIVCAKWAMELGFSQPRQLLWGIAGFAFAPLILLILYNRLIRRKIELART